MENNNVSLAERLAKSEPTIARDLGNAIVNNEFDMAGVTA